MATIEEKLSEWQKELLQFDNRNRLLNLKYSSSRPSMIPIVAPTASEIYAQLYAGKKLNLLGTELAYETEIDELVDDTVIEDQFGISVSEPRPKPYSDSPEAATVASDLSSPRHIPVSKGTILSTLPPQKLANVALRLAEKAKGSEQEQGISVLYAAFGLLKWHEETGPKEERRSPLVLMPLTIVESLRASTFQITANTAGDPELNLTLIERIRRDFGLNIGFEFDEEAPLSEAFANIRTSISGKHNWDVIEESYIGIFQFHKFRMFKDLSEHSAIAAQNAIVQALGLDGITLSEQRDGAFTDIDLDREVQPPNSFTILDADGSQLRAIESIKRGSNLIISGPPGTGKSQTIANIIAECLVARKTVLFVAEKSAALEVVHQRLASKGLDEFCLMLHSQKATKRDVIMALGARMTPRHVPKAGPEEELGLRRLAETRSQLNSYAAELSNVNTHFGKSPSWVHGQLARLRQTPFLIAQPPDVTLMSYEDYDRWFRLIDALAKHALTLREGANHPWSGIAASTISLSERNSLRSNLEQLRDSSADLYRKCVEVAAQLHQSRPGNIAEANRLLDIQASIPRDLTARPEWFQANGLQLAQRLATEALEQATLVKSSRDMLASEYTAELFRIATDEAISTYESASFFTRLFSGTYKEFRSKVRSASVDQRQRSPRSELESLRQAKKWVIATEWFRSNEASLQGYLGLAPSANAYDPEQIAKATSQISSATDVIAKFPQQGISSQLTAELCTPGLANRTAESALSARSNLENLQRAISNLKTAFNGNFMTSNGGDIEFVQLQAINEWASLKLSQFDLLDAWLDARAEFSRVNEQGIGPVAVALVRQNVRPQDWQDAFRRFILTHWLDHCYQNSTSLKHFRGENHEDIATSFRELDRRFVNTSPIRLRRAIAASQPLRVSNSGGEPEILLREVGKQRRHMPIRRLFERIPNLLPTLKPCLMMSPLSVAQFLSADHYTFDVVIFDEASQVRPHDAIGAIMRGKQLVIAGDRKQLPPTSFFDRQSEDSSPEDESNLKDMESILDALQAKDMPSTQLMWHYRSRHEELIAFSNRHFYGDRLITFPTPVAERTEGRGVHFEYVVDGLYVDERDKVLKTPLKVNRSEAKRVAKLVMDHARNRPGESLGVVALGSNQKGVVEDEIRSARILDSSTEEFFREDKDLPFFVKALEEVQGDERDVMIVSIGFGKNVDGRLSHNFGPINRDGGERRLNVLITRAKHQVVVVSSIRASDIDLNRTQKLGPYLLRQYLDFAERGSIALDAATSGGDGDYESPFEEEVGAALERSGHSVHRQIGCSKYRIDLAVIDPRAPGRYLLGVECDGATYHSSKTARDRDRLRQEVLESLGWKIHRVWSTDWIRQPDKEFGRLLRRIEEELSRPLFQLPKGESLVNQAEVSETEHFELSDSITGIESEVLQSATPFTTLPYVEARISSNGFPDILTAPIASIAKSIASCVETESPVHHDVLLRRISAGWGYSRTGARITEQLNQAVLSALKSGAIERRGQFYWDPGNPEVKVRSLTSNGAPRSIEHIAGEEIIAAFEIALEHAMSLRDDELILRTARLFGYQRTGPDIQLRLSSMIQLALVNEKLESRNGRLVIK